MVGPSFAKEIFFTARQFSAQEAKDMGLVDRVVPEAMLDLEVAELTKTIFACRATDSQDSEAMCPRRAIID